MTKSLSGLKKYIKSKCQYIYIAVIIALGLLNPSATNLSSNNISSRNLNLPSIHRSIDKCIDDEITMCTDSSSTPSNVPLNINPLVSDSPSSVSNSRRSATGCVDAFTTKPTRPRPYTNNGRSAMPYGMPNNVLNQIHGGPSSIVVSGLPNNAGGDPANNPSGSDNGDHSTSTSLNLNKSTKNQSPQIDQYGNNVKKKKKKSMTDEEVLLDTTQTKQDFLEFIKQEKESKESKDTQFQNSTSQPRPRTGSSESQSKNDLLKVENEEQMINVMDYAETECQEYVDYVNDHLVHESFNEEVPLKRLDQLSVNDQFNPAKPNKNVEKRTAKSMEEAQSVLHAEKMGLTKGKVERVNRQEFLDNKITTDFVVRYKDNAGETKRQAVEQKAPVPELLKSETTYKQMGERVASRGLYQCEQALKKNSDVTSAVLIIDHKYLSPNQSVEIHKGVEYIKSQNKNVNISIHEINLTRP